MGNGHAPLLCPARAEAVEIPSYPRRVKRNARSRSLLRRGRFREQQRRRWRYIRRRLRSGRAAFTITLTTQVPMGLNGRAPGHLDVPTDIW